MPKCGGVTGAVGNVGLQKIINFLYQSIKENIGEHLVKVCWYISDSCCSFDTRFSKLMTRAVRSTCSSVLGSAEGLLLAFCLLTWSTLAASETEETPGAEPRADTYLEAYADSYSRGDVGGGGGFFGEPSPVYSGPAGGGIGPGGSSYGPPPSGVYGPPQSGVYGPPQPQPRPVYGPPSGGLYPASGGPYPPSGAPYPPPHHDHHHHHDHHDLSPAPYAAPNHFFPPIPIDIGLLLKILLKAVIFKLIVKFMAVICLLLFLPAVEMYKKGVGMVGGGSGSGANSSDDERSLSGRLEGSALGDLTQRVTSAVDAFTGRADDCSDAWTCKLQAVLHQTDKRTAWPRLLVEYLPPLVFNANATSTYRDLQRAKLKKKSN